MTEARTMQVTEETVASKAEQVAHGRPAVERWFTYTGLIPLPVFLLLHLGRELTLAYAADVSDVVRPAASLASTLSAVVLVWAPLGIHAALGSWFLLTGRKLHQPKSSPELPRLSSSVSRLSGLAALAFMVYHAREYPVAVWLGEADARDAGFRLISRLSTTSLGVPVRGGAYLVGLLATAAHAGLGVHRALLSLGVLNAAGRRRTSARACAVGGALLFCIGAAAVIRVASGVLLR